MANIDRVEVRMYRMGTGDCFALKFYPAGKTKPSYKMMIDGGTWSGSGEDLAEYIEDLKTYFGNQVDLLVITHEHKDHVHTFDVCEALYTDPANGLKVDRVWMGWTERDKDKKVQKWKKEFGEKKAALAMAAEKFKAAIDSDDVQTELAKEMQGERMKKARENFSMVLNGFADLHGAASGEYKGGLKGMDVVKKKIAKDIEIECFTPGTVVKDIPGLDGIRFYVLGPPELIEDIKKEKGGKGESYDHNKELAENDALAAAVLHRDNKYMMESLSPFEERYFVPAPPAAYSHEDNAWRKIDNDWLAGAGSLALRMNSLTNNLSLAMAIEFEGTGNVMLFPGDAEYGSWSSWHNIPWTEKSRDKKNPKKHFTEDLLNRTIFYKVAHHLSHNGTAQRLGLEMMTNENLTAMATLDYSVISANWKNTMPNRAIIKELLNKTKGRLMIMQLKDLFLDFNKSVPLEGKIKEARTTMSKKEKKFFDDNAVEIEKLYLQYTVHDIKPS